MSELKNLDWFEVLNKLCSYGTSEKAKSILSSTSPLKDPSEAEAEFEIITQAQLILSKGQRPFMESLDLFSTWYSRIDKSAQLKAIELKDIRSFFIESLALYEVLNNNRSPWSESQKDKLMDGKIPLDEVERLITPQGDIRNDASEKLQLLTLQKKDQEKKVVLTIDKIVKQNDLESIIQDRYFTTREGRIVIPIKSGSRHDFKGIIHDMSSTKQTVFMEPEQIISLNNQIKTLEKNIQSEINRLLVEISNYLSYIKKDILRTSKVLLNCDIYFSKAQLGNILQAKPVKFSKSKLKLIQVRHPLLVLSEKTVVANSVELDIKKYILLLSGPNAGGKTVLLKSIGLAAQMARCGLLICAENLSTIPFYENIFTSIGDFQSVDQDLSTFAAHLKSLNKVATTASNKDLVLIDEICGSTDPEEGAALARSFIEEFVEKNIFCIITSHLSSLKIGWRQESPVVNGSMESVVTTGYPTYQFLMGVPGNSYAIRTAEINGISKEIIKRAYNFLTPEARSVLKENDEIKKSKSALDDLRQQLFLERQQTQKQKAKYEKLIKEYHKEKEERLNRALKKAETRINQLMEKAGAKKIFEDHNQLHKIKESMPQIIKTSVKTSQKMNINTIEDFSKHFPPGSQVYISDLKRDAIVQGKPNHKDEVPVLANSMRLMIHWKKILPPNVYKNPTSDILRRSSGVNYENTIDNKVDVRGLNSEDAIIKIESFLDTAILRNEKRIKIIHGHGTEVLKKNVRIHLSKSLYVKTWTAGRGEQDGMTLVEIQDEV